MGTVPDTSPPPAATSAEQLIDAFLAAYWGTGGASAMLRDTRGGIAAGLAAVHPLIETAVRVEVAAAIEAARDKYTADVRAGLGIGNAVPLPAPTQMYADGLRRAAEIAAFRRGWQLAGHTVTALLTRPGEPPRELLVPSTLETLRRLIGEDLRAITGNDWHAWVTARGAEKMLPVNHDATRIARHLGSDDPHAHTTLRGPVVFFGNTPDGEETDVPAHIMALAPPDRAPH